MAIPRTPVPAALTATEQAHAQRDADTQAALTTARNNKGKNRTPAELKAELDALSVVVTNQAAEISDLKRDVAYLTRLLQTT